MTGSLVSVREPPWDAFPQDGAVLVLEKEEKRRVGIILPRWSPFDIGSEDSWELIFLRAARSDGRREDFRRGSRP